MSALPSRRLLSSVTLAAATAVACGNLSPSPESDPCTQLSLVCDSCKLPTDQQNCEAALAAADDVQCATVLDQSGFLADCTPRDGGADAPVDAPVLPACGAQASADAGCSCSAGSEAGSCSPACPAGGCDFTCVSGTCTPTCEGGHCTLHCLSGATCEAACTGGGCIIDCKAGSQCANTCTGGGCAFQCEEGAVCTDTCGSATTCVGV